MTDSRHRKPRLTAGWLFALGIFLLIVATSCGDPGVPNRTATVGETTAPSSVLEIHAQLPAFAAVRAVRIDPPETPAPTTTVDLDGLADAHYADYPCAQWAGEALAAGWPHEQMPKVLRTMFRESRCQWDVRSTTSDSGLLQINDIVLRDWRFHRDWPNFDRSTIFVPAVNLAVAHWLWTIDGWRPWVGGA